MSEQESGIPEKAKNFKVPDESERIENPDKAEAMARASIEHPFPKKHGDRLSVDQMRTEAARKRKMAKTPPEGFDPEDYKKSTLEGAVVNDQLADSIEKKASEEYDQKHGTTASK